MGDPLTELRTLIQGAPMFPDELVPDDTAGYYECPCCGGEGAVDKEWVTHARSNAWPGGVQFYGVGHEHQHAERLYLAARKHLPALLRITEAAKGVESAVKARLLLGSLPEGVVWTERHHDAAMAEGCAIGALIDALSALKPNQEGDGHA